MPAIFLDCTDDMAPLWDRVQQPGDPAVAVNMAPGQPADIPALLAGYDVCINDHSYFDAATLSRCAGLKRIVFLGTGASSFIDIAAAERCGIAVDTIKGYGDTTVAEHTVALAMAAARSVPPFTPGSTSGAISCTPPPISAKALKPSTPRSVSGIQVPLA